MKCRLGKSSIADGGYPFCLDEYGGGSRGQGSVSHGSSAASTPLSTNGAASSASAPASATPSAAPTSAASGTSYAAAAAAAAAASNGATPTSGYTTSTTPQLTNLGCPTGSLFGSSSSKSVPFALPPLLRCFDSLDRARLA